jgi:hypothetical protein
MTGAAQAIQTLRSLCATLSEDRADAPAVAASLGAVRQDMGENLPLFVKPSDPSFAQAQVVREYGGDAVNQVVLDLAPGDLRLKALVDAFGPYVPLRVLRPGQRQTAIFSVDSDAGRAHVSRILAEVDGALKDDAHVLRITVTRDPRLD